AEVETNTKKAYAKGHVMIFKKDVPHLQGEEIYYDFENHTGSFPNGRSMNPPWYAKGEDIQQVREGVDTIKKGSVTTCNLEKPHYEIRCKRATLYVNEKLVLHSATLYVLGKPVFWLPWMDIPLNWPNIPFQTTQGYGKKDGFNIGVIKGVTFNKNLWGKATVDWRQKRGTGGGWTQNYDYQKWAKGNIKLYWTEDRKAPTSLGVDSTGAAAYTFDELEKRKRGRGEITWRHRTDLDDKTTVLLRYHRVADPYFLQEFFEEEYRGDVQPHSFVTTTRNSERYGAMVHLEKRMNSFETMVERMPEVRLDWKNQPFFTDKVFNESRVQFDNLKLMSEAYAKPSHTAIRTDAYSRWVAPLRWKDVNFTPYAGYRGTEYSHQLDSNASKYRSVMDYGADLRTHFYKIHDVSFEKMGIEVNQLRHIVEPSIAFQGTYSTVSPNALAHFDTVDALDNAANVILGVDNRLQTKRIVNGKMQRVDIVSFNTYLFFNGRSSAEDPNFKETSFPIFENKLVLRPYEWLQLQTRVQFDFANHYLKRADQDIILRKGKWRFLFGYSQVHDYYDYATDVNVYKSQQFIFDARYKINSLWMAGGYVRWDSSNRTRLNNIDPINAANTSQGYGIQEWEISATRDLHDFILEFGVNARHSLLDSANTNKNKMNNTAFVRFTMKGLPVSLGSGGQSPFCAPRIGETVAGANESGGFFDSPMTPGEGQFLSSR
ncbi:MAG: LPS assembly protein LptD, partial [Candidatus Omnitrophota bacterium]